MVHGITRALRHIVLPPVEYIHRHRVVGQGVFARVVPTTYVNPERDRSLRGKARRNARKAARR